MNENYESPVVEVIETEVEQGFTISGGNFGSDPWGDGGEHDLGTF